MFVWERESRHEQEECIRGSKGTMNGWKEKMRKRQVVTLTPAGKICVCVSISFISRTVTYMCHFKHYARKSCSYFVSTIYTHACAQTYIFICHSHEHIPPKAWQRSPRGTSNIKNCSPVLWRSCVRHRKAKKTERILNIRQPSLHNMPQSRHVENQCDSLESPAENKKLMRWESSQCSRMQKSRTNDEH